MEYNTEFDGLFVLDRPLTKDQRDYLVQFNRSWRVKRDADSTQWSMSDPLRKAVNLSIGTDAEYFVGSDENDKEIIQSKGDKTIVDFTSPPSRQPSQRCHWVPNEKGTAIIWDGHGNLPSLH